MAVAGDDEALDGGVPGRLEGARHDGGGLAGADDDRAAARLFGQMGEDGAPRIGRVDRGAEQLLQQVSIHLNPRQASAPATARI